MKNSEYWQTRAAQNEAESTLNAAKYTAQLQKQYEAASRDIDKEISEWYYKLAENNNIDLSEVRKFLSTSELKDFHMTVEEYIEKGRTLDYSKEWEQALKNASAKVHISRLESMKLELRQHVEELSASEQKGLKKLLTNTYSEGYYKNAYTIQKGIGVGSNLMAIDQRVIDKALQSGWAADGLNFSDRIWKNKKALIEELNTTLVQNLMQGNDPYKITQALAKRMNVGAKAAGRLVMTENSYFYSAATKECFKDLGVEKYQILATLDSKTSEICRNLDREVFDMKDYEPGSTAPPFHCWCRTTTVPYFDDEFEAGTTRAARDEEGKYTKIPANMTYKEWKEEFIDRMTPDGEQVRIYFNEKENDTGRNEKDKLSSVDFNYIYSTTYKNKIDDLGESEVVSKKIYSETKGILKHRADSKYEDLIYINSDTGQIKRQLKYNKEMEVKPTKQMVKMVNSARGKIIGIHNHPYSACPSKDDIVSATERKYKYGIVICHNGIIYKYNVLENYNLAQADFLLEKINVIIYNRAKISDFDSKLSKYLKQLKLSGVIMQVIL